MAKKDDEWRFLERCRSLAATERQTLEKENGKFTYIHIYVNLYVCKYIYKHTCAYMCTCRYICIYMMHICLNFYTHMKIMLSCPIIYKESWYIKAEIWSCLKTHCPVLLHHQPEQTQIENTLFLNRPQFLHMLCSVAAQRTVPYHCTKSASQKKPGQGQSFKCFL